MGPADNASYFEWTVSGFTEVGHRHNYEVKAVEWWIENPPVNRRAPHAAITISREWSRGDLSTRALNRLQATDTGATLGRTHKEHRLRGKLPGTVFVVVMMEVQT